MSKPLPFVVSNVYYQNNRLPAYRDWLADLRPAVAGLSEAQRLRTVPGYTVYPATPGRMSPGAREVAVAVRHDVPVQGFGLYQLTRHTGQGWAHDRWAALVRVRWHGERVTVFSLHANARALRKDTPAARQNIRLHNRVLELIRAEQAAGWTPLVLGDFNRSADHRGRGTPHNLARRAGLDYRMNHIDGALYPRSATLTRWDVLPAPGSNHRGIVGAVRL